MRIYFCAIVLAAFTCCKNEGSSSLDNENIATSTNNNSNTEIEKLTEQLHKTTPNEKNISHYRSLIHENISIVGRTMHEIDSIFHLIDSTELKAQTRFSNNRTRLIYLNVIKHLDSAEVLTRSLFKTTNVPENMSALQIDYELFYYLSDIKIRKGECDSAIYFNKMLNSTIEQDSTEFHEIQLENARWINTWLKKQCR